MCEKRCTTQAALRDAGGTLTFVGHPEAQGAAGVIRFKIEPHLVARAHHKVWCGRPRQAAERRKHTCDGLLTRPWNPPHHHTVATLA